MEDVRLFGLVHVDIIENQLQSIHIFLGSAHVENMNHEHKPLALISDAKKNMPAFWVNGNESDCKQSLLPMLLPYSPPESGWP